MEVNYRISQSGKTKEIVEALEWCNAKGATTIGLTQKRSQKSTKRLISVSVGMPVVSLLASS